MEAQNVYIPIGAVVSFLIPPIMGLLKKKFPDWDKKAWFPLVFGATATVAAAAAAGQVHNPQDLVNVIGVGLSGGGIASSLRDVVAGK